MDGLLHSQEFNNSSQCNFCDLRDCFPSNVVLNVEFGLKINAESFQRPSDKTSNSRVKRVQLCFYEKNTIENLLHQFKCIELKSFLEQTSTKKILPLHFSSSLLLAMEMSLNAIVLGVLRVTRILHHLATETSI